MFRTSSVHHQERFLQAVFADLVCGNTRTTRHVQPLQSCRKILDSSEYISVAYVTMHCMIDLNQTDCRLLRGYREVSSLDVT